MFKGIPPLCLALVLCDTVIEDTRTRNKSLINMFNGLLTPAVPVRHDKMCAFAVFSGGRGRVPIALRLCYDKDYETDLLLLGGTVQFPQGDPNAVVDIVFEIRGFVFQKFGQYTFELVTGGTPIMTRRFSVSPSPQVAGTPAGDEDEDEGEGASDTDES
jgi:hypothetical protein